MTVKLNSQAHNYIMRVQNCENALKCITIESNFKRILTAPPLLWVPVNYTVLPVEIVCNSSSPHTHQMIFLSFHCAGQKCPLHLNCQRQQDPLIGYLSGNCNANEVLLRQISQSERGAVSSNGCRSPGQARLQREGGKRRTPQ